MCVPCPVVQAAGFILFSAEATLIYNEARPQIGQYYSEAFGQTESRRYRQQDRQGQTAVRKKRRD